MLDMTICLVSIRRETLRAHLSARKLLVSVLWVRKCSHFGHIFDLHYTVIQRGKLAKLFSALRFHSSIFFKKPSDVFAL